LRPASSPRRLDLDHCRAAEVLGGRSRRWVERCLRSLPERHWRAIEVAWIDPSEASAFARGLRRWRAEVRYLDEPTTDGYAENVINEVQ
jgi:hypothetical protein